LATSPAIGRPGRIEDTRELVIAGMAYIVPYRLRADAVEIIAVLHSAQRWPDRFP
jgi:plasmid stabilization system protein ParE